MLRKTGEKWEFESEVALENFVWTNLENLFNLTALKRQHCSKGELCDILALDARHLVVLELKNAEDRYIVQQLTRYYDNLLEERPYELQVDYEHPIRLVAIAPSFHRHNFVDRKYHKLEFQFLCFDIIQSHNKFYLQLKDVDSQEVSPIEIPYQEVNGVDLSGDIPSPPKMLLEPLGTWKSEEQERILGIRHQVLSFDKRMQETVTARCIKYGRGRNCCLEFWFDKKQRSPILFLWLPLRRWRPTNLAIGRHRIWTDWECVFYICHIPEGLGQAKPQTEWDQIPREAWPRKHLYGSRKPLIADQFSKYIAARMGYEDESNYLKLLVNVALEKWQARL